MPYNQSVINTNKDKNMIYTKTNILKTLTAWLLTVLTLINKLSIVAVFGFLPTSLALAMPIMFVGLILVIASNSLKSKSRISNSLRLYENHVKVLSISALVLTTILVFYSTELALIFNPLTIWLATAAIICTFGCISYARYNSLRIRETNLELALQNTKHIIDQKNSFQNKESVALSQKDSLEDLKAKEKSENEIDDIPLRKPISALKSESHQKLTDFSYTTPERSSGINKLSNNSVNHTNNSDASTKAGSTFKYQTPDTANTKKLYGAESKSPKTPITEWTVSSESNTEEKILLKDKKNIGTQGTTPMYTLLLMLIGMITLSRYSTLEINNNRIPQRSSSLPKNDANKVRTKGFKIPMSFEEIDALKKSFE